MSGGIRIINNGRPADQNIMKNTPRKSAGVQEFTWPPEALRSFEERDAVVAALQVFLKINELGLGIEGRDPAKDMALYVAAERVLGRVG